MKRRVFCKMIAAATVAAIPTAMEAGQETGLRAPEVSSEQAAKIAETPSFKTFDTLTEDYAEFCATPAEHWEFFEVRDEKFVKERLDEATWKPSAWGNPPRLLIAGGSQDGVPMEAPIAGLEGDGPYKATLLIRRSILRARLLILSIRRSTSAAEERSVGRTVICTRVSPRSVSASLFRVSSERATRTRLAPCSANCLANASPKPDEAPVIRAVISWYIVRHLGIGVCGGSAITAEI
jgi:hypothetical protein